MEGGELTFESSYIHGGEIDINIVTEDEYFTKYNTLWTFGLELQMLIVQVIILIANLANVFRVND